MLWLVSRRWFGLVCFGLRCFGLLCYDKGRQRGTGVAQIQGEKVASTRLKNFP